MKITELFYNLNLVSSKYDYTYVYQVNWIYSERLCKMWCRAIILEYYKNKLVSKQRVKSEADAIEYVTSCLKKYK